MIYNSLRRQKTSKQNRKRFLLLIILPFVLITSLVITICVRVNVSLSIWRQNEIFIGENLAPFCKSKKYVYHDIEGSVYKFDFINKLHDHDVQRYCPDESDPSLLVFLAYTKQYYYFLNVKIGNNGNRDSIICRVDLDLENYEEILTIQGETKKWIRGFDQFFYFENKSEYFVFDFKKMVLKQCETGSSEASIIENGVVNYRSRYMNPLGNAKRVNNSCVFSFDNDVINFDETLIETNIYNLILKCGFKPYYNLSYINGLTSLLYYANPDLLNFRDCLIVDYERKTGSVLGYQLFSNVDMTNFHLYRQLDF